MIKYTKHTLDNGLRVLLHQDHSTPMVAVNVLYDVGSRDEDENLTGFAHLFEHLMFGGSKHIPNYDEPLQKVGAQNNAFTSADVTNYYITVPKNNLETALWLESDRMLDLAFDEHSLEVQRKVVIEEFKQRYLNQPYGDAWLLLRPLVYKVHPYKWATIGKEISHIENARMDQVKAFYQKHYSPQNAILVLAGAIDESQCLALVNKWFGDIPAGNKYERLLPTEPVQTEARSETVYREVPQDAIWIAYRMPGKYTKEFYMADIISDVFSRGNSSRFEQEIVKSGECFTQIDAYVSGDIDSGLFIISGRLVPGTKMKDAEKQIQSSIQTFISGGFRDRELQKVKNKIASLQEFNRLSILNKSMALAFGELHQTANLINEELQRYQELDEREIMNYAQLLFSEKSKNTLYYLKKTSA